MKRKDEGVKNIRQQRQLLSGSERAAFAASVKQAAARAANIPENCCWRLQGRGDGCFTVLRRCIHTESLRRGEAVLRVRSHGKQCRAGGDIKIGLLQEKHLSDGAVSVLLVSGGEVFFFFGLLALKSGSFILHWLKEV